MVFRRRYWVVLAIASVLTGVGAVALTLPLLAAGLVLGLWLLAQQFGVLQAVRTLRAATISFDSVQQRVAVDTPVTLYFRVDTRKPLPFDVTVMPALPASVEWTEATCPLSIETGQGTAETTFDVNPRVAGEVTVGPPVATFNHAGGLFAGTAAWEETITVRARPRALRQLHVGEGGDPLTGPYGEHQSDTREAGLVPGGVREYMPGDQLSRIDWKATARLNHPHLREFEVETARETLLVIDHRASMGVGPPGETKLACLHEVALAFVDTASEFGDPLGLYAVGDDGTTTAMGLTAGVAQYDAVRETIKTLEPTTTAAERGGGTAVSPAQARTIATRLDADKSAFARTLQPYVSTTTQYVHRLADRPLFRTVRAGSQEAASGAWTVLFTDDTTPTETREAVKLARRNGGHVLVFLAPSVLYTPTETATPAETVDRYVAFEEFRDALAAMSRVSAFEVAPRDRLAAVLARDGQPRQVRRKGIRRRRRDSTSRSGPQNPLAYAEPPLGAADTEETEHE